MSCQPAGQNKVPNLSSSLHIKRQHLIMSHNCQFLYRSPTIYHQHDLYETVVVVVVVMYKRVCVSVCHVQH